MWHTPECGLVHAAISGFDYNQHEETKQVHRYKCKDCTQEWSQKTTGGRFLVIYDGKIVVQVILNEPTQAILHAHLRDRQRFVRKPEPSEELRDTIPVIPKGKASVRIRATCPILSAQIWESVLGDHEGGIQMEARESLAKEAVEENKGADKGDLHLDTRAAAMAAVQNSSDTSIHSSGVFTNVEIEDL